PILAVEISLDGPHALEAIGELRRRAGEYLLVGAGAVNSLARLEAALAVEAHFTAGDDYTPALITQAQTYHGLHLPTIRTSAEAERVLASGCPMFKSMGLSAADLSQFGDHQAAIPVNPPLPQLGDFVKAGAVAVAVDSLVDGPAPAMSAIITAARHWSAAWKRLHL
ncbi:MAG: hypothetical protein R3264_14360, partial [Anaerolineae bacterium]|nr:hypothetical protein [Anaerolineae bacterium]